MVTVQLSSAEGRRDRGQPGPERPSWHANRKVRSGALPALMAPAPATTAAGGLGQWLPAVPADLRDDNYDLIHLIDR